MPELTFLNSLDFTVLGLYMLAVLGVGFYVARFNKGTADYFKGGGNIPWRLSMLSLFISGFSAFMFVGAAGIAYGNGGGALLLFSMALPAYLIGAWIFGPRWRRTRLDTPLQFLTRRYSQGTTYFYTVLAVVPNTLVLGIMIYTLCIFISAAMGINATMFELGPISLNGFQLTMLVTGLVIVAYTTLGGLWAVMVTDAVQFIIVLLITLIMTPLAYTYLGGGNPIEGISRLFSDAPEGYFRINLTGKPILFWPTWFIYIVFGYNVNWHIAQRYYSVSDERDTRKMAIWAGGLSLVMPILWIIPIMVTPILFPNIAELWPNLAKAEEASFVTLALAILPHGMLGLLTAAIFAATMSSTDTTFNWLGAVITKDVYVPLSEKVHNHTPSEKTQLWVGKLVVASLGLIAIWIAFNIQKYGGAFDVYMKAESLYKITLFVPVFLGILYTRTPWWSAIASVGAGVLSVLAIGVAASIQSGKSVTVMNILFSDMNANWFGFDLTRYELNALVGLFVCSTVFIVSAFLNKRTGAFKERIESFENDLNTPAYADEDHKVGMEGLKAYQIMAVLSIGLGGLLILLMIPTLNDGGWLNGLVGAIAIGIGILILKAVRLYTEKHRLSNSTNNPS
jgi:Na+/proline symporter